MTRDEIKRQHEFDLMDRRLGEQRIIEELSERIDKRVEPLEKRMTVMEHWRTALASAYATACIGVGIWFKTNGK